MEPTIPENGQYAIFDRFSYRIKDKPFCKGDVVIAVCPTDPNRRICKRIEGVEKDIVCVSHHHHPFPLVTEVPAGHVYLCGDNPGNSTDSRNYGPVPTDLLLGKLLWRFNADSLRFEGIPDKPQVEKDPYQLMLEQRAVAEFHASRA